MPLADAAHLVVTMMAIGMGLSQGWMAWRDRAGDEE